MKYCENLTVNHIQSITHPSILYCIKTFLKDEGCTLNPSPFENCKSLIINGDKLEEVLTLIAGKTVFEKKKSVDLILGIKSLDNSIKQFQFIELKLRTKKDFYHLDKYSFRDKVNASTNALGNSQPISNKYYIVFRKDILNVADRFLFRINPRLSNDFKAIDITGLHTMFF